LESSQYILVDGTKSGQTFLVQDVQPMKHGCWCYMDTDIYSSVPANFKCLVRICNM